VVVVVGKVIVGVVVLGTLVVAVDVLMITDVVIVIVAIDVVVSDRDADVIEETLIEADGTVLLPPELELSPVM